MRSHTNDHAIARLDILALTSREQKRTKKLASHCFKSKQISLSQQNRLKLYSLLEKLFSKNSRKKRMKVDKTSPKNRNPKQQKMSRNATKKNAQLATLIVSCKKWWKKLCNRGLQSNKYGICLNPNPHAFGTQSVKQLETTLFLKEINPSFVCRNRFESLLLYCTKSLGKKQQRKWCLSKRQITKHYRPLGIWFKYL